MEEPHLKNQYHYAVRKSKKQGNLTRAKKLFEASFNSDVDLLKEMKAIKQEGKVCSELPEHVAGADGEGEIVEKFREVYQALYNSAGSAQEMDEIKARLSEMIGVGSLEEVNKITGSVVKEAASLMKSGKILVATGQLQDHPSC